MPDERHRELRADRLSLGYLAETVVEDLDLAIPIGRITALVGPNGSGKSTILKAMARILTPRKGAVLLDGIAIQKQPTRQVARELSILPQSPEVPAGLTVGELVSYGRFPHQAGLGLASAADHDIIARALEITRMRTFEHRAVDELSGGQRQRAWIAMALAQDTPIMLLDEPTTHLDMAHQLDVLQLLQRLNAEEGRTIVMVVHDLNHAARFAHHMVAIDQGRVVTAGSPASVLTAELVREVFRIEADIVTDARHNVPMCIPYDVARPT